MPFEPLLSVVATSRNDNHGGDLNRRMQLFLDGLATQADRHEVPVELVLVEWNPPPDRPGLREELRWPPATRFFQTRIVVVPPERHQQLDPKGGLPIFQMIAKNVGIRRARGRYVLATNVDILFPDPLFRTLKSGLRPGLLYRNDRLDVSREIPVEAPFDERMEFARTHVLRRHQAQGTFMPRDGRWVNTSPSALDACRQHLRVGRYKLAAKAEEQIRQRVGAALSPLLGGSRPQRWIARGLGMTLGLPLALARRVAAVGPTAVPGLCRESVRRLVRVFRVNRTFVRLHTNGCGDFTLLDRETWFRLRGYPEWPVFSWAIDSVFLFQADANHVPNVQLRADQCTYHVDHGGGWTPEDQANLFSRLEGKGIAVLSDQDFFRLWDEMRAKRRRRELLVYNGESWGLADVDLREEQPGARS